MTEPPLYQNDLWNLSDDLGLGRAGDQVARMALEAIPPFTLGITGKWGSGKTSVMRRAFATLGGQPLRQHRALAKASQEEHSETWKKLDWRGKERRNELETPNRPKTHFDPQDGVFCVWFSPWQHQNEDNPLVPLLKEIRNQFQARLEAAMHQDDKQQDDKQPGKVAAQGKKWWKENRRGLGLAGIKLLGEVADAAIPLARGATDRIHQAWRAGEGGEPAFLEPSDGQRFHLLFEDAVEQALTALKTFPLDQETFSSDGQPVPSGQESPDLDGPPPSRTPRLVIFIDDLDRCEEDVIVRLLEAIKLYLASRHCLFVFGLDDDAVLKALESHWPNRSPDSNREYLEKLFQAILMVPLPAVPNVQAMVAQQMVAHGIPFSEELAQDMERLLEPNPRKLKNFVNGFCAAWELHRVADWLAADAKAAVKAAEAGVKAAEAEAEANAKAEAEAKRKEAGADWKLKGTSEWLEKGKLTDDEWLDDEWLNDESLEKPKLTAESEDLPETKVEAATVAQKKETLLDPKLAPQRAARRFLMMHYLRLYHRPVWRLLERQPDSLSILANALNSAGKTETAGALKDETDQRLLREFYSRAFSHVLPNLNQKDPSAMHRNEPLAQAVKNFEERQDRKRSDEYLRILFNELLPREINETYQLNPHYLCLTPVDAP